MNKLDQACRRQVEDVLASQGPLTEFRQTLSKLQSEHRHITTELSRFPSVRDVDDALSRHRDNLEARIGERVASLEDGLSRQQQAAVERLEGRGGETWRTCLQRMAVLEEKAVLQSDVARIVDRTLSEVRTAGPELFGAGAVTGPAALTETRKEMRRLEAKVAGVEARLLGLAEDSTTEGRIWRASLAAKVEALERAMQEHSAYRASQDTERLAAEEDFRQICEAAETASQHALQQAEDAVRGARQVAADAVAGMDASLSERINALDAEGRSRDSAAKREMQELASRLSAQEDDSRRAKEKANLAEAEQSQAANRVASVRSDVAGLKERVDMQAETIRNREAAEIELSHGLQRLRHELEVQKGEVQARLEEQQKHIFTSLDRARAGVAASPGATAASFFAAAAGSNVVRQPQSDGRQTPLDGKNRPSPLQISQSEVSASPAGSSRQSSKGAAARVALASPAPSDGQRPEAARAAASAASPALSEAGSRKSVGGSKPVAGTPAAAVGTPAAASSTPAAAGTPAAAATPAAAGTPAAASTPAKAGTPAAAGTLAAAGTPARLGTPAAAGSPAVVSPTASARSNAFKATVSPKATVNALTPAAAASAASPAGFSARPAPPELLRFCSPTWQKECDGEYSLVEEREVNGRPLWKKQGGERWLYFNTDKNWTVGGSSEHDKGFDCKNGFIFNARTFGASSPDILSGGWMLFDGQGWREDPDVDASVLQAASAGSSGSSLAAESPVPEAPADATPASTPAVARPTASAIAGLAKKALLKDSPPISPTSQASGKGSQPGVPAASPTVSAIGEVTSFHQEVTLLSESPGQVAPGGKAAGAALADSAGAAAEASDDEGGNSWDGSASASLDMPGGGSLPSASPRDSPEVAAVASSPPPSGRSRFNSLEPVQESHAQAATVPAEESFAADGDEEDAPFDNSQSWDAGGGSARSPDNDGPQSIAPAAVAPPAASMQRPAAAAPAEAAPKASSSARNVMADLGFDSNSEESPKFKPSSPGPKAKASAGTPSQPQSARDVMADLGFDSDEAGAAAESDSNPWD